MSGLKEGEIPEQDMDQVPLDAHKECCGEFKSDDDMKEYDLDQEFFPLEKERSFIMIKPDGV